MTQKKVYKNVKEMIKGIKECEELELEDRKIHERGDKKSDAALDDAMFDKGCKRKKHL